MHRNPHRARAASIRATSLLLVLALAFAASPARATWPNDPTTNVLVQKGSEWFGGGPAMTTDGAGGAIIAAPGLQFTPHATRVDAFGRLIWDTPLCPAFEGGMITTIVADGVGGAIVPWSANSQLDEVRAQRINATGTALWGTNGVPVCTRHTFNPVPQAVSDGAGGAIVAWMDDRNGGLTVYAQRLSPTGAALWTADGVKLSATWPQYENVSLAIVSDDAGGAILSWADSVSVAVRHIRAQRVSAAGTPLWGASGVTVFLSADDYFEPALARDGSGGAYVVFSDSPSNTGCQLFAQHLNRSGAAVWAAAGLQVSGSEVVDRRSAAPDGSGGVIVGWTAYSGPTQLALSQRVRADGTRLWGASPVILSSQTIPVDYAVAIPDGAGGATVTWWDHRSGTDDIYAQRLDASGAACWAANGTALAAAAGDQWNQVAIPDGAGGILAAWDDQRAGTYDIYAQRIDAWGVRGGAPVLTSLHDWPGDQGGHVELWWTRSALDGGSPNPIASYSLWRQVPEATAQAALARGARLVAEGDTPADSPRGLLTTTAQGGQTWYWEYLGGLAADGRATYEALVATACDSTPAANPRTVFMVQAKGIIGGHWWSSPPESTYSVDNIAPPTPTPFTGTYASFSTALHWGANPATDIGAYRLYRGGTPGFAPGPANLVVTTPDTGYVDHAGQPYYYKVVAVDLHGNASGAAFTMPSGTADAPGLAAPELALAPPAPNPARGVATLRFALPRSAPVTLAVFDQQGRRVRTLATGIWPAGTHALAWDGRDDGGRRVASGLYFVRLDSGGRTLTRRLVAMW